MGKKAVKDSSALIMEYGADFTKYYLMVLFLVLPLVFSDGYKHIAKDKYAFYMFITTSYILVEGIVYVIMLRRIIKGGKLREYVKSIPVPMKILLLFLLSNIVTFIFAIDHKTALIGCWDWYMGLLTWAAMIVSAFFVCNFYVNKSIVWVCGIAGSGIAALLAVFNRFGLFLLDKENKNGAFLSTIGNNNWFCGYHLCFMAVGAALCVTYDKEKIDDNDKVLGRVKNIIPGFLFIYNMIMDMAALLCGSDTALLGVGALFFILMGVCLRKKEMFVRFLCLAFALGAAMEIVYFLARVMYKDMYSPYSGYSFTESVFDKHVGTLLIIISLLLLVLVRLVFNKMAWNSKASGAIFGLAVVMAILAVAVFIALGIHVTNDPDNAGGLAGNKWLTFNGAWGSSRGLIWNSSLITFSRYKFSRKLIGVGQGCYYLVVYSVQEAAEIIKGRYGDTNLLVEAHNEYINLLVENGIIAVVLYAAFTISSFFIAWKRSIKEERYIIPVIALVAYFPCSMLLFHQVMVTPYLFVFIMAAMTICENDKVLSIERKI